MIVSARMTPLQRWLKSRKRFWVWGEARMYLRVATAPDAEPVFEDGDWMIRSQDGRYLLNGDAMGFPVPREFELEQCPPKAKAVGRTHRIAVKRAAKKRAHPAGVAA